VIKSEIIRSSITKNKRVQAKRISLLIEDKKGLNNC